MKVLVTGGAGFIGSHTVDLLLKKGYQVRAYDSLEPPVHPHRDSPSYLPQEVELIHGDIRDKDKLAQALRGVEAVFHLAAYQDYLTDFSKFAQVNDGGTALLYEIIVREQLPVRKVVVASSQAVYGEGKYLCPEHGPQYPQPRPLKQLERGEWDIPCPLCGGAMEPAPIEEERVNPHNQYAISKYAQELYSLILGRRYGIPTVALRYAIIQGPRQSFHSAYSGVLRIFSLCLLQGQPLPVYEDGKLLRNYLYVGDAARANLMALEKEEANYRAFNVANDKAVSVLEYAQLLSRVTGIEARLQMSGQFRFGDTRHILSDISQLRSLGWQPTTSLEATAREYLAWLQTQPQLSDSVSRSLEEMRRQGVIRDASASKNVGPRAAAREL